MPSCRSERKKYRQDAVIAVIISDNETNERTIRYVPSDFVVKMYRERCHIQTVADLPDSGKPGKRKLQMSGWTRLAVS